MADDSDDDLDLRPADAGVLFRAEMWATNAVLGYWKHALAVIGVVLFALLAFGQLQSWEQKTQRRASAQIAQVLDRLPVPLIELAQQAALGGSDFDPQHAVDVATELESVAQNVGGVAKVEALLKAAELYRLASDSDQQRRVLEQAAQHADGVLRFAALGALADLELEAGEKGALERLEQLRVTSDGFLAEQATLDLARAYEHFQQPEDARRVYEAFVATWPNSTRIDRAHRFLESSAGDAE